MNCTVLAGATMFGHLSEFMIFVILCAVLHGIVMACESLQVCSASLARMGRVEPAPCPGIYPKWDWQLARPLPHNLARRSEALSRVRAVANPSVPPHFSGRIKTQTVGLVRSRARRGQTGARPHIDHCPNHETGQSCQKAQCE